MEIVRSLKELYSYVVDAPWQVKEHPVQPVDHTLPDGRVIYLGAERFQCTEPIFQPHLLGIYMCCLLKHLHYKYKTYNKAVHT